MSGYCSSGRALRQGEENKPCGRPLTLVGTAKLCPSCDGPALELARRPVKPTWEPPEAKA